MVGLWFDPDDEVSYDYLTSLTDSDDPDCMGLKSCLLMRCVNIRRNIVPIQGWLLMHFDRFSVGVHFCCFSQEFIFAAFEYVCVRAVASAST